MEGIEDKVTQLLTCSICLDVFKDPKTLLCEHSFCKRCLKLTFQKNQDKLFCPTCRNQEDKIIKLEDIDMLGTSLYLKQTMEAFAKDNLRSFSLSDTEGTVVNALSDLKMNDQVEKNEETRSQSDYYDSYEVAGANITVEEDNDLKKDVCVVSDLETDSDDEDEEVQRERVQRLFKQKKKKKKSVFGKISKRFFGHRDDVLHDILYNTNPRKHRTEQSENQDQGENQDQVDAKIPSSTKRGDIMQENPPPYAIFCSFCNKTDHDLQHCAKANMAARHEMRKQYARTAAVVGTGYLAQTRPSTSSMLMNQHTPGVVGYNASQGMSRGRGSTTTKKVQKKASNTGSSRIGRARGGGHRCKGRGKGGRGRGRGSGVVFLL